jgi:hypothetical protein
MTFEWPGAVFWPMVQLPKQTTNPSLFISDQRENSSRSLSLFPITTITRAGFQEEILIGDAKSVHQYHSGLLAWDSWFIGALFMLGAFQLVMFLRRSKNPSSLYLSLMAFAMVFRSGLTGQRVLYYIFGFLSQETLVRFEFMVVPLLTIPFLQFLMDYYCSERMKIVKRVFLIYSVVWALATAILPYYYTGIFSPFTKFLCSSSLSSRCFLCYGRCGRGDLGLRLFFWD